MSAHRRPPNVALRILQSPNVPSRETHPAKSGGADAGQPTPAGRSIPVTAGLPEPMRLAALLLHAEAARNGAAR